MFGLRPNYGRVNEDKGDLPQKDLCTHLYSVLLTLQQAAVKPRLRWRLLDTHRQVWLHLMWGHYSFLLASGAHKVLFVPSISLFHQSCGSSVIKSHYDQLNSWPLVVTSTSSPSLLPRSQGVGLIVPTLYITGLVARGTFQMSTDMNIYCSLFSQEAYCFALCISSFCLFLSYNLL